MNNLQDKKNTKEMYRSRYIIKDNGSSRALKDNLQLNVVGYYHAIFNNHIKYKMDEVCHHLYAEQSLSYHDHKTTN